MRAALAASLIMATLAGIAALGDGTPTSTGEMDQREVPRTGLPRQASKPSASGGAPSTGPAPTAQPLPQPAPVALVRPPVPLPVGTKSRLPDRSIVPDSKPDSDRPGAADPIAGQMSQQAARSAIEADGYKGVRMLNQSGDGTWRASAMRGATRIVVKVDPAGNVLTE